ncbi:MAG: hypothetical protein AAF938_22045, partial [Myxococcota bacterium]
MPTGHESKSEGRWTRRQKLAGLAIVVLHALVLFHQSGDLMTRGHNGWNSAAYQLSARNSLRFELLFPLQYYTGIANPGNGGVYTHHPVAMHVHNTAAMWLLGDDEATIRGVAAFHGVLALIALMFFIGRWWGPRRALLAGAAYSWLPIVVIYGNMANHVSGYLLYILLSFHAYFRYVDAATEADGEGGERPGRLRWFLALLLFFAIAGVWDWPANYAAVGIALHWFVRNLRAKSSKLRGWLELFGYCIVVLAVFGGHFLLVHLYSGGLEELFHTIGARQSSGGMSFSRHLRIVPALMFTWPVLAIVAAWIVAF